MPVPRQTWFVRYLPVLSALLLVACRGSLSVEALYPGDDDSAVIDDDDDSAVVDDDDVVVDDDDVVVDDDDVVVDDDDFVPPTGCESGPDEEATAEELVEAADFDPLYVTTVLSPDTSPLMLAVREGLGNLCPLVGSTMALMSTGNVVNIEDQEDFDHPGSGADTSDGDRAMLEVTGVVPADIHTLRYYLLFLTREYPEWVGSKYTDAFEATIDGVAYAGSIAFDEAGDPISPNAVIPLVGGDLAGTGFDVDGATGWIRMDVPVAPGDPVVLTFTIYDVSDGVWDSAVLLDGFEWRGEITSEPTATLLWP